MDTFHTVLYLQKGQEIIEIGEKSASIIETILVGKGQKTYQVLMHSQVLNYWSRECQTSQ